MWIFNPLLYQLNYRATAKTLDKADALRRHTVRLDTLLPRPTAIRLGRLLRITNSFYSNPIKGQYIEPLVLAARAHPQIQ